MSIGLGDIKFEQAVTDVPLHTPIPGIDNNLPSRREWENLIPFVIVYHRVPIKLQLS
ncbi:MAG: hypothetical protein ABI690_33010 [Chloroflexota bacterium]